MSQLPFETVLCPVDFSDLSGYALRYALELAKCGGAKVVALHAAWWEAPVYFTESRVTELQREFRKALVEAERRLHAFIGAHAGPGTRVDAVVREALPADAIRQAAAETGAQLIVMGTHGRSGWNRWTLGSVAERVLRESTVPVLTVRNELARPIRRILCAVSDTSESRSALALASELGACFEAEITALHVNEPRQQAPIPNLCAWIPVERRARCNIREMVRDGDAAQQIIQAAAAEDFDLLVIGAPRRRFFDGMVLGTTTLRAVRHAPCPVLTVS